MIVDSTLVDETELSRNSLDAALGENVSEIRWCQLYYPSSEKVRLGLSIKASTNCAHEWHSNTSMKTIHFVSKFTSQHYPIQCYMLL